MFVHNMKKDEILGLLAVLIPGSVWASIDSRGIPAEHEIFPQASLDVIRDNIEENAVSSNTIMSV